MTDEKPKIWIIILVVIGVLVVTIMLIIPIINNYKYQKEVQERNAPLTEDDFKILSAGWNEYQMKFVEQGIIPEIPKKPIDWEITCNYCLTGILGSEDFSNYEDKEKRCSTSGANFLLQSSRNLTGNFIIDGIKHESYPSESSYYLSSGVYLHGISENLRIDKEHTIILCAKNADAYPNEDHEEICKSITLPAKCT